MSALLSDTPATVNEEMLEVGIELIEANSLQPRTYFDDAKLEELAQSIRSNGIIQPLLVRPHGMGRYQIIAGERRWRAAQLAGLRSVPVVIRQVSDDRMLELALVENIQRQELNAIEEAHAYKRLIETFNLTQEVVAQRVGRDRTFITNYLRLLRLPDDVQRFVEEEKLSMGHARALVAVDDPEIQRRMARNIIDRGLSVRETERAIKRVIEGEPVASKEGQTEKKTDANIRAAEAKMRRHLSTQVRLLPSRSGPGGKIEIEYYTDNDLHRLYTIILGSEM